MADIADDLAQDLADDLSAPASSTPAITIQDAYGSKLRDYWEPALGRVMSGANVTSWQSQILGIVLDWASAAGSAPAYSATDSSLNGAPGIVFGGGNDVLTGDATGLAALNEKLYIGAVVYSNSPTDYSIIARTFGASDVMGDSFDGAGALEAFLNPFFSGGGGAPAASTPYLVEVYLTASRFRLAMNRTLLYDTNSFAVGIQEAVTVLTLGNNPPGYYASLSGGLGHVVFAVGMSQAEIDATAAWWNQEYALGLP
jgi:hypothetical protein